MSLSLAGPCVMEFRRGGEQRALFLPPRSLLVMADEARYAWHHYIPHRRSDPLDGEAVPRAASRVSFTFRKVRPWKQLVNASQALLVHQSREEHCMTLMAI